MDGVTIDLGGGREVVVDTVDPRLLVSRYLLLKAPPLLWL